MYATVQDVNKSILFYLFIYNLSDELAEQAAKSGRGDLHQSKGAARLFKRINSMLNTMDGVVKNLEVRHQGSRHLYEAYRQQTPIVRYPHFFGKSCFSLKYVLVTPVKIFGVMSKFRICVDEFRFTIFSECIGFKKGVFRHSKVTAALPNSDTYKDLLLYVAFCHPDMLKLRHNFVN
jgi:hypothetical protein